MSGGVVGGPSLWTRSVIDVKGTYLGSGWVNTPCAQNSVEFGTVISASYRELQCQLHNPDIESGLVIMCYGCGDVDDSDNCVINSD